MKLGLTSLDLLAIVKELQLALISARMDNIYQLEGGSFLLKFRGRVGYMSLLLDLPRRLNLTSYKHTIPERPSPAATQLRRLLKGLKVEAISQVDFDRILCIDLDGGIGVAHLYIELFGEGNLIVTDSKGTIKYALVRKEMRDRTLKLNLPYAPPPRRGADIAADPPVDAIHSQKASAVVSLTRTFNIPPELAEEGLIRASIPPDTPANSLDTAGINRFLDSVRGMIREVGALELKPNQVHKEGKAVSFHPVIFKSSSGELKSFTSFNEAVDDYFSSIVAVEYEEKQRSPAEQAIADLESILQRQKLRIAELQEIRKKAGEEGRLIITHLDRIQGAIDSIRSRRKASEDWGAIMESLKKLGVLELNHQDASMKINLEGKEVVIDFRESASANAERRFKDSKDAVKKLDGLAQAMRETEERIKKVKGGMAQVQPRIVPKAMKKDWYERFRWFRTSDSTLAIGGRDSTQNEVLVKKYMAPGDIFVHADVPGGSVVILKGSDSGISEASKREAASFAASYSRAWGAGLGAVDAYWVNPEQVTKSPPSGEYLGKGAFMIYGAKNYIRNAPLQLCLGVDFADGAYRVRVSINPASFGEGSPFVRLIPGDLEGQDLVRRVKELLAQRAGALSDIVLAIPDQDIEGLLPRGGCSVL